MCSLTRFVAPVGIALASLALGASVGDSQAQPGSGPGSASAMRGGGNLQEADLTYGFTLSCEPDGKPANMQLNWLGNRFHLTELLQASCTDDPDIGSSPPRGSRVDVHEGMGEGRLNGQPGASVRWTFEDAGEPGDDDFAALLVTDADGVPVLSACGTIAGGNNQGLGSAPAPGPATVPGEDPVNVLNIVDIEADGTSCLHRKVDIPEGSVADVSKPPGETDPAAEDPPPPAPVINPLLEDQLDELGPGARVEVLVQLEEALDMPRLPDLPDGVTRDSAIGAAVAQEQQLLVDELLEKRTESQLGFLDDFAAACGQGPILFSTGKAAKQEPEGVCDVEVRQHFWLVNGLLAEISLGALEVFEGMDAVVSVDPRFGGEVPPNHDGNSGNDVDDGRALITSDPYFNLSGMTGGYIGLLDSGVRASHTLFGAPNDNLAFLRDCVDGGASCNDSSDPAFDPDDDCWNHGTSTAAILTGNANLGNAFRGVTDITLDSWKVYPNGCGGLDAAAVVRGFQRGLLVFNRVFVGEMQSGQGQNGSIATAADNAFDAGAVVVAANGNQGPGSGSVRSPALAHRVIGIGDYDVQSLATINSQGRGPASDGRYKPDVQTPTNTETASTSSSTALQTFTGTSGATPYGAGAAALLRNWLRKFDTFDPGQVYAQLIEAGDNPWLYDNTEGAGDLSLITCARAQWGKVAVLNGFQVDIPISVGPGRNAIEAAIWWPEGVSESHNDIDLYVIDPGGATRDVGFSSVSVFERVRVTGSLTPGTWKLRVKGFSVPSFVKVVYFVADVRGC